MQLSASESVVGRSEGLLCELTVERRKVSVALLVVSTNSSGHDRRDKVGSKGVFYLCMCVLGRGVSV